jgi:hypothetical protein
VRPRRVCVCVSRVHSSRLNSRRGVIHNEVQRYNKNSVIIEQRLRGKKVGNILILIYAGLLKNERRIIILVQLLPFYFSNYYCARVGWMDGCLVSIFIFATVHLGRALLGSNFAYCQSMRSLQNPHQFRINSVSLFRSLSEWDCVNC